MRAYVARTWGAWDESVQAAMFRAKFQPAMRQIVVVDGQAVGVVRVQRRPDALFLASIEVAPWSRPPHPMCSGSRCVICS
jgi:hypothetical protein